MKTHGEIIKAAKLCNGGMCDTNCPYYDSGNGCSGSLFNDMLTYIERNEVEDSKDSSESMTYISGFITTPAGTIINVNRIDGVIVDHDNADCCKVFVGGAGEPFCFRDSEKEFFLSEFQKYRLRKYEVSNAEQLEAEREGKSDESA